MLKRLVNELRCTLLIRTEGPVLVKSGHSSVAGPDMTPVRTYRGGRLEVYLPGSSLKGVIRSHLEKVGRTLNPGAVCNPFLKPESIDPTAGGSPGFSEVACSEKFQARKNGKMRTQGGRWCRSQEDLEDTPDTFYADSCPVCRLFGSNSHIGRLSIGDAYLTKSYSPNVEPVEFRDGVGIDRISGGAAPQVKFDLQAISPGVEFAAEVLVRNFECWQLGMLLAAFADLRDGLLRVGMGRSRGLGAVTGSTESLSISFLGALPGRRSGEVWGLGKFLGDGSYGTVAEDVLVVTPSSERQHGLRSTLTYEGDALQKLQNAAIALFVERLQTWEVPAAMCWPGDWRRA